MSYILYFCTIYPHEDGSGGDNDDDNNNCNNLQLMGIFNYKKSLL
jgi:hypothetical protein